MTHDQGLARRQGAGQREGHHRNDFHATVPVDELAVIDQREKEIDV